MDITRNLNGVELKITLTEEELRSIVAEFATITFNGTKTKTEPETKKEWHPVKELRCGVLNDHAAEVIDMYRQGLSLRQIAKHYGVCASTVNACLKKNGVQVRTMSEGKLMRYNHPAA